MRPYRLLLGLLFTTLCVAPGCSNLIGLGGYSAAGEGDAEGGFGGGEPAGGAHSEAGHAGQAVAGATPSAGAGGDSIGEGGEGGEGGSAGRSGDAGSAGAPGECDTDCNDDNECTDDACVSGKCSHEPAAMTAACGTDQVCDGQGVCVRCLDTVPGTGHDLGCPVTSPVCVGKGRDALCGGCTKDDDCADNNDCTTEKCTDSKCVISAVAAGAMCATGVCNGATPEKCVTCLDDASGPAKDTGCTANKPTCDPSNSGTCYACVQDADCASDNVSCTVETCTNHVCTHVATDSKCTSSGDVCKPNRCDAALDCKQVDISVPSPLMDADNNNGSFENAVDMGNAVGWTNTGAGPSVTYDCVGTVSTGGGCKGSVATTYQDDGNFVAWFGGTSTAEIDQVEHQLTLLAGTQSLTILADMNLQTQSVATSNKDSFTVTLLDANKVQIGQPVVTLTNADAQTSAPMWKADFINKSVDVSAQAGKKIYVRLRSSVDATLKTDFFVDNVRIVATICQ